MVQGADATSDEKGGAEERVRHEVKPPRKAVDVRVVEPRAASVVVEVKTAKEWYRAVLPLAVVRHLPETDRAIAFEDDLQAGRYGEDWASMVDTKDFPKRLADALHEQGIFSFSDLRQKLMCAKAAVSAAHGRTLADLLVKEK